jgi:release factor glutamine methyltransferase
MARLSAVSLQSSAAVTSVAGALAGATGRLSAITDDAGLEAEVLLAHTLGVTRSRLLAMLGEPLPADAGAAFEALVARRLAREPLAYITGEREFYGLRFAVAPGVLLPRPETELLVEIAVAEARRRAPARLRIADVGTGSGCVATAIAAHAPNAAVVATDTSPQALRIAVANATALLGEDAGRVAFVRADLLDGFGRCDVVVANLPYVPEREWRELAPEVRGHEPRAALVGGKAGTEVIERLIAQAPAHLAPRGVLAVEFGFGQAQRLVTYARSCFAGAAIDVRRDLAGVERVLVIRTGG